MVLKYESQGKSGDIVYFDEQGVLEFYYEFCGGNCIASIYVPTTMEWHKTTNRSLDSRNEILKSIAEQVILDKAPNSTYSINENRIDILKNPS